MDWEEKLHLADYNEKIRFLKEVNDILDRRLKNQQQIMSTQREEKKELEVMLKKDKLTDAVVQRQTGDLLIEYSQLKQGHEEDLSTIRTGYMSS